MTDPAMWTSLGLTGLAAVAVVAVALLKGWRDWIGLQRSVLDRRGAPPGDPGGRIELADLRERVRKLEAIAAGVDF